MSDQEKTDFIAQSSIDDLLRDVIEILLHDFNSITATKGDFTEQTGVLLEISNPRARLSRTESKGTLFSCLGEFLWYMSGSNDLSFIQYYISQYSKYSDDGSTLYGAYGPRLNYKLENGFSQLNEIIRLLNKKNTTRKAIIQISDRNDLATKTKDMPCTCTLQFLIRHDRLNLITNMRSNDIYKGLPHDVFAFTMIQELIARSVDKEVGVYKHMVGSLHLYNSDRNKAAKFLDEGWSSNICMPEMPKGSPWPSLKIVLSFEKKIRLGKKFDLETANLEPYWLDLVRLLVIFKYYKDKDLNGIRRIDKQMSSDIYRPYICRKCEILNEENCA